MLQITAVGFLGGDSDLRTVTTANGPKDVLEFSLGVNVGKDGTRWFKCSLWGAQAAKMDQHFKRGTPLVVWGYHKNKVTESEKHGKTFVDETITVEKFAFAGKANPRTDPSPSDAYHAANNAQSGVAPNSPASGDAGDDLPF